MNSAFHPAAKEEFLAAIDFYNESVPGRGAELAAEIEAAVDRVKCGLKFLLRFIVALSEDFRMHCSTPSRKIR